MTAKTTLYHPRGPAVEITLANGEPTAALAAVQSYLDAGWLAAAPSLEIGEQRDDVCWVVKGEHEKDGEATPFVLLYSVNEALKHSFLKVYLNRAEDVAAFEFASKMRLDQIPLYIGNDKPERGKSSRIDQFILKAPKPFGVVFKANPKHNEEEAKAAKATGAMYSVPKRVFVRWLDQMPAGEQAPAEATAATNHAKEWGDFLNADPTIQALNAKLPELAKIPPDVKAKVWATVRRFATDNTLLWNETAKRFEMPAPTPEPDPQFADAPF